MKKMKQIFAIAGIVFLLGLYILTFVMAIVDPTETMSYFKASIVATILIPTLLWIYMYIFKLITKNREEQPETTEEDKAEEPEEPEETEENDYK